MAKIERSITINAPVEKVFSYINDPMSGLEYNPSLTDIRDVTGIGVGDRAKFSYKMMGIPLSGELECMERVPNERLVIKSTGGAASTWTYTVKPEDGGTRLNVVVDYTIPVPVLGKFAERLVESRFEREADILMVNIKERMET